MAKKFSLHTTAKSALVADKLATVIITVVGFGVIVAVLGLMAFLVKTVLPLGTAEKLVLQPALSNVDPHSVLYKETDLPIFLIGGQAGDSCKIEIRSPSEPSKIYNTLYVTSGEGTDGKLSLSKTPSKVTCLNLEESALFVLGNLSDGGVKGRKISLGIGREFLPEAESGSLSPDRMKTLSEKGWDTEGETIFYKASKTAPVARLNATISERETLNFASDSVFFKSPESLNYRFNMRAFNESEGLFIVKKDGKISNAFAYTQKKNEITGQAISLQWPIDFDKLESQSIANEIILLTQLAKNEVWRFLKDGRIVRSSLSENSPALESLPLRKATLKVQGFDKLAAVEKIYGGNAYFLDNGEGKCGTIDTERFHRNFPLTSEVVPEALVPLWSGECKAAPDIVLLSSPKARLVVRAGQNFFEAFETTTGRIAFSHKLDGVAFSKTVTPSFSESGSFIYYNQNSKVESYQVVAPHLEASREAFFGKIHYESYEEPSYSWQSSASTEDFQAKMSLIPLIFGTLKATFFAMIFAVPLGIFSAIYSSEILDRQTRNFVKPSIEMMASLPSVVLGFLAAIVLAPWIEAHVLSVLLVGMGMPFLLYLFGTVFSSISAKNVSARGLYASRTLLISLVICSLISLYVLIELGLAIEHTAFGGDIKTFLAGGSGNGSVLWAILFLPVSFVALWSIPVKKKARRVYRICSFFAAPILALGIGFLLSRSGDMRGELVGTYAQRNTLVIAIAMGFAIIPIIYSISEDALTAVPSSLRAASLACGASVWQTTARVVLPTAASGLFSALMIGLGRAMGETMIVVMAAGNTAVINLNPFEGLRSLSANIAVELPEATQGSTHYRTLFLSALLLFCFTFLLNSCAEFLRAKFRERNKAL